MGDDFDRRQDTCDHSWHLRFTSHASPPPPSTPPRLAPQHRACCVQILMPWPFDVSIKCKDYTDEPCGVCMWKVSCSQERERGEKSAIMNQQVHRGRREGHRGTANSLQNLEAEVREIDVRISGRGPAAPKESRQQDLQGGGAAVSGGRQARRHPRRLSRWHRHAAAGRRKDVGGPGLHIVARHPNACTTAATTAWLPPRSCWHTCQQAQATPLL